VPADRNRTEKSVALTSPRDPLGNPRNPPRVPRVAPSGATRGTPRQKVARVLKWVASGMAVVVLLAAGGLWWAFRHYDGQIRRIAIPPVSGVHKPDKAHNKGQNFLLVGSDTRDGANGEGTQGTGKDFVTGQRSDTVILIHLYGSSNHVELVSFPRDSWVDIPEYKDPKTGHVTPEHHSKLNSAFSEGGPALLVATIEQWSQIRIDHYLEIDFTGFKGMVNKLGGVDVCLTKPAVDHYSGIHLTAGHHHISGDVALAFVRQRHGLANGDIDRIARQQQFLGSLAHKVLSAGTLLDPFKLTGVLDVATSALQVDDGLKANDLKRLALRMRSFRSGGVLFTTVPVADTNARRAGQSVVLADDTKAAAMFQALRDDRAPGTAPAPKPSATPAPVIAKGDIHVSVFNGTAINGLGRKAATALGTAGFTVVGKPASRGTGATATTIHYGKGQVDAAHVLQAALPGSQLVEDDALNSTLEVVVGSSYRAGSASPAPKATSTKPPVVKTAEQNPCTR
jgi:LCP family protein required for cell wall assembly